MRKGRPVASEMEATGRPILIVDQFNRSAAADIVAFDRAAGQRTAGCTEKRAQCLRPARGDRGAQRTTGDTTDDQARRTVIAAAIITAVLADIDAVVAAQTTLA